MDDLCLSGLPNENWKVHIPAPDVPPEFPEPMLGINFLRDEMERNEWLTRVAIYSDTWLLALAFFHGIRRGFDQAARYVFFSPCAVLRCAIDSQCSRFQEEKIPFF